MSGAVSVLLRVLRVLPACALGLACGTSIAQTNASSNTPADASPASKSSATSTTSPGEPGTRVLIIEDDNTRIEELHVRGEAKRVVVQSKRTNLPAWEIRPDSPGRTQAGEQRLPRDTANTRMWRVMSF